MGAKDLSSASISEMLTTTDTSKVTSDPRSRLYCRDQFAACVVEPDSEIDLARAALWLAAEEYPDFDPQIHLGQLESLADRVRTAWRERPGTTAALDALRSVLVEEESFGGNSEANIDEGGSCTIS